MEDQSNNSDQKQTIQQYKEQMKQDNKYQKQIFFYIIFNLVLGISLLFYHYFKYYDEGKKSIEQIVAEAKGRPILGKGDYSLEYYQQLKIKTNEDVNINELYLDIDYDKYPPQSPLTTKSKVSPTALEALQIIRNPNNFRWFAIPLLAFIAYVYAQEIYDKNWSIVCSGLFFFACVWSAEVINEIIFHITQFSGLWTAPGDGTAFLIFIGINLEIAFMFLVAGIIIVKTLPKDKNMDVLGMNNRIFFTLFWAFIFTLAEVVLHDWEVLGWEFPYQNWWINWPHLIFLLLLYCAFNYFMIRLFDISEKQTKFTIIGVFWASNVYITILFWIVCL